MIKLTDELVKALVEYDGVLPLYLRLCLVDNLLLEYDENLRRKGLYDDVYDEYYTIRVNRKQSDDREQFDKDEYDAWLEDNPQFQDLIQFEK